MNATGKKTSRRRFLKGAGLGIVAPAIVPALGFQYRWVFAEVNLGGLAVATVTAGFRF